MKFTGYLLTVLLALGSVCEGAETKSLLGEPWETTPGMMIQKSDNTVLAFQTSRQYAYTAPLPLKFQAKDYNRLRLKVKTDRPVPLSINLYFTTDLHPALEEKCRVNSVQKTVSADSAVTYTIDLAKCPNWSSTVTGMRLDFNGEAGIRYEISELQLYSSNEKESEPASLLVQPLKSASNLELIKVSPAGQCLRIGDKADYAYTQAIPCMVAADDYNRLTVKLKLEAPINLGFGAYFTTKEYPELAEERKIGSGARTMKAGKHSIVLDLANVPTWKGDVTGLRIDFSAQRGSEITIEEVVLSYSTEPVPAVATPGQ